MKDHVLAISDAQNKYKNEWIFLIDCEFTPGGELRSGKVVLHTPSRDEIYRKLVDFKNYKGKSALRYTGEIPKDLTVVLWTR